MSLKICFYASIKNEKKEEIDLLKYYKTAEKKHCIYKIEAGEICSEFIARYFNKTKQIPNLLLNELIEENYDKKENAKEDMKNGIYKANISKMTEENNAKTEIKTFKESKIVREKLIKKYEEIKKALEVKVPNSEIEIYAIFEV